MRARRLNGEGAENCIKATTEAQRAQRYTG